MRAWKMQDESGTSCGVRKEVFKCPDYDGCDDSHLNNQI